MGGNKYFWGEMDTRKLNIKQIKGNKENPRKINPTKFERLVDSLLVFPKMLSVRPIVVDDDNVVLGGNMRLKALRYIATLDAGHIQQRLFEQKGYRKKGAHEKANIVNWWAAWLKEQSVEVALASGMSEDEKNEFIVKDNASFGDWDFEEFQSETWNEYDLEAWGIDFEKEEPEEKLAPAALKGGGINADDFGDDPDADDMDDGYDMERADASGDYDDEEPEERHTFTDDMYRDVLYDFDNDMEIPNLRLDRQAGRLELPLSGWGSCSRNRTDVTTYHFYVDDYRFEALFKDPIKLLNSGCRAIVEPNCSLHDQTPIAFGLNQIYKKRYLARFCQEMGVDVYVDLNVAEKFRKYNKLGIPKGYNAFMTRGLEGWMISLENDLKDAQEISGLDVPNLIVYGGGKEVQQFCKEHSLLYVTDFINAKVLK